MKSVLKTVIPQCYSFTHAHRFIGYRNIPQPLVESVTRLIDLRVYDSRASSSKPTPSPSSLCYSLTHAHRSIGYRNITQPLAESTVRLTYLRVYDSRARSCKPAPSPSSLCYSLTHAPRSIGYRNIPQPLAESTVRLIYLRVYDSRGISSNVQVHTIPVVPILLAHTWTQVHWLSKHPPVSD